MREVEREFVFFTSHYKKRNIKQRLARIFYNCKNFNFFPRLHCYWIVYRHVSCQTILIYIIKCTRVVCKFVFNYLFLLYFTLISLSDKFEQLTHYYILSTHFCELPYFNLSFLVDNITFVKILFFNGSHKFDQ